MNRILIKLSFAIFTILGVTAPGAFAETLYPPQNLEQLSLQDWQNWQQGEKTSSGRIKTNMEAEYTDDGGNVWTLKFDGFTDPGIFPLQDNASLKSVSVEGTKLVATYEAGSNDSKLTASKDVGKTGCTANNAFRNEHFSCP